MWVEEAVARSVVVVEVVGVVHFDAGDQETL